MVHKNIPFWGNSYAEAENAQQWERDLHRVIDFIEHVQVTINNGKLRIDIHGVRSKITPIMQRYIDLVELAGLEYKVEATYSNYSGRNMDRKDPFWNTWLDVYLEDTE